MTKEEIRLVLREVILKWTGVDVIDDTQLLLSLKIPVEDFIYVVLEMENNYGFQIITFIKNNDVSSFTIEGLSEYFSQNNLCK